MLELLGCGCKKCNEQCSCYINSFTSDDEYSDDDEVEDDVDENNDDR